MAEQAAGGAQGATLHDSYEERHSGEINSQGNRVKRIVTNR
jgi:hypothetical protein